MVALDRALVDVPHAFGGALALAYYAEPRATVDIDINVFVSPDRFDEVAVPLASLGVDAAPQRMTVERDGQARVFWDDIPLDLFFAYDPFHDAAARARRMVPFGDVEIPILSRDHLMVCKAVFDRPKDWMDLDNMMATGERPDGAEVLRWVARIAGDTDPRYDRIATLLTSRR